MPSPVPDAAQEGRGPQGVAQLATCSPRVPARCQPSGYGSGPAAELGDLDAPGGTCEVGEQRRERPWQKPVLVEEIAGEEVDEWVVPERPGSNRRHLGQLVFSHWAYGDRRRHGAGPGSGLRVLRWVRCVSLEARRRRMAAVPRGEGAREWVTYSGSPISRGSQRPAT